MKKAFGLGEMAEPMSGVGLLQRWDAVGCVWCGVCVYKCVCEGGILTLSGFRGTVTMGNTVGQTNAWGFGCIEMLTLSQHFLVFLKNE